MDFALTRGDDEILSLTFTQDGSPIDITGWTIFFTAKKNIEDEDDDAVLSIDVTVHTAPLVGETEIPILSAETDDLEGPYFYDIQYKDDSVVPIIKTVLQGQIIFKRDVTRRTT